MVRPKPKAASGVKRSSPSANPPAAKRQKKSAPAKRKPAKKVESESDLSEEEAEASETEAEHSEDEEPTPRRKGSKQATKDDSESDLSDLGSSEEDKPKPKRKTSTKPKPKPKSKTSESELSEPSGDEEADEIAVASKTDKAQSETKTGDIIDSESELSSVIDEPPPKKRGKAAASSKGSSKQSSARAPPKQLSADEEEIKKLQGHLVKCGIRKIWGIELKQYGDDSKAKIRHLRRMLTDAGMTGRFSEARAKEIKEQRELMADLEAVTDMNALWGSAGAGGRASRSKAPKKSLREASDDEDGESDDDNEDKGGDDDDDEAKANSRVSKRMADLAFLGDDSESD